jgi:type II secretory ATPase GspE/PulE/Tfp pilus assembly ATPase PilB-like protein
VRFLLGQRLVKRLCPRCRRPHRKANILSDRYRHILEANGGSEGVRGPIERGGGFCEAGGGCPGCNRSGFVGRLGIFEFREIRQPVSDQLLRQRNRFDPIAAEAAFSGAVHGGDLGARSLREDGILKASAGLTTPEEVFGATMEATSHI